MENLRYNASDKFQYNPRAKLFGYWKILASLLLVVVVLVYLFPQQALIKTLINQPYISEVDFYYSLLLMKNQSGLKFSYKDIYQDPQWVIKLLVDVEKNYSPASSLDNLWFNYIVLRVIATSPKMGAEVKQQAQLAMVNYLNRFKQLVDTPLQMKQLGEDALSIHQQEMAFYFYEHFLNIAPHQSLYVYARAGQIALWANNCLKSADYYFIAQHLADNTNDKRYFYFKAVKILVQCQKTALGLQLADQNIKDGLAEDSQTYKMLVDIAIMGNQPAKAQQYLFRYLQLKNNETGDH